MFPSIRSVCSELAVPTGLHNQTGGTNIESDEVEPKTVSFSFEKFYICIVVAKRVFLELLMREMEKFNDKRKFLRKNKYLSFSLSLLLIFISRFS